MSAAATTQPAEYAASMSELKITMTENGPYQVSGPITLLDADGGQYDVAGKEQVYLCRCGASTNKPFCDGTHSKLGFEAAERAVARQG